MSMSQKITLGYAALVGLWQDGPYSSGYDLCNHLVANVSDAYGCELAEAALVFLFWNQVGGLMGYLKSGSQKSLGAGGGSALLLYFVYTQLPLRPAFASSIGLGLSAALLVVMGSRFRKSGKIFPAGVVSLFSLVMVGGYAHGIMRGLHA